MSSFLRIAFLGSTIAWMTGFASGKTGPQPTVSIRLYDQAQVPAAVLHSAMMETARLFRAAGIRISWRRPLAESPEDRGTDQTVYQGRLPDERPYVVIRLIRRTPASVYPGALGYALPLAHSGAHVLIFYDRIEELTEGVHTTIYVILGDAIAHELGHVLLGSSEHSNGGLMQGCWTPATWHLASEGLLAFRHKEIERMHAGLRRFQCPEPIRQRQVMLASSAPSQ